MSKTLFFTALASLALVLAQTPPDVTLIPSACSTQCASVVEVGYLCQQQYADDVTALGGCFCAAPPSDSDVSTCASCLGENNAAALQTTLTNAASGCAANIQQCFFQCSFDTCPSADIACQCSESYLASIFNCASCNTANGNTGATQIGDFNNLQESCANQNYTGANTDFTTSALPSPTGQDSYTAPVLTGTGGGLAATGSASAAAGGASAPASAPASASIPTTISSASGRASASSASAGASSARSSARSNASSASNNAAGASASATPSGAASSLQAPAAFGGLIAVAGFVAALF